MSISDSGAPPYPFKWHYRPQIVRYEDPTPVAQIVESAEEVSFQEITGILQEIDDRHWNVVRQLLIEAKLRAESLLTREDVIGGPLATYYIGWLNHANYVLANLEGLRSGMLVSEEKADTR